MQFLNAKCDSLRNGNYMQHGRANISTPPQLDYYCWWKILEQTPWLPTPQRAVQQLSRAEGQHKSQQAETWYQLAALFSEALEENLAPTFPPAPRGCLHPLVPGKSLYL